MFGSAACDAGSKYAEPIEMRITPRYANGQQSPAFARRAAAGRRPVRIRSTTIISLRRSTLSTTCPAIGVTEEDRQRLAEQHQRRQRGRAGELQDEIEQRDGEKPVAAERDQRSDVEQAEVAVVAEKAPVHAARDRSVELDSEGSRRRLRRLTSDGRTLHVSTLSRHVRRLDPSLVERCISTRLPPITCSSAAGAVVGQERVRVVVLRVGLEVFAIDEPPFVDVVELGKVRVAGDVGVDLRDVHPVGAVQRLPEDLARRRG